MNFIEFRHDLFDLVCFNINQVYAYHPEFDKNNLTNWAKKGYILKLRQGYYTFPEYLSFPGFTFYIAHRIYRPSYISLHTALSFYGLIPEAVSTITCVTSLKTRKFINDFGRFSYQSVKETAFFGYELKTVGDNKSFQIALPEKAIVDLFYFNPFYSTEKDFVDLRFDKDYLHDELDIDRFKSYSVRFSNSALEKRVERFIKAYEL